MIKPARKLSEKAYEKEHIKEVLSKIEKNFTTFFSAFISQKYKLSIISEGISINAIPKKQKSFLRELAKSFDDKINEFYEEQHDYKAFFATDTLEEYDEDPNAFKKDLTKNCPIIRRCMNSPAKEMKKYKNAFRLKTGRELLTITKNIILFGQEYMKVFNSNLYENAVSVDDLGISKLLEDDYISYEVIGGGIKSNFLYSLYPDAFPNRSQNSIWALWYLSGQEDFGFKDGSEFLMLDVDNGITQQNFHYPYDLFTFYALKVYLMLKDACMKEGYILQKENRYIYLNAFLDYIALINEAQINELRKRVEYELY